MADRATDNRSADEIRRDIEGARADMHETVDALERKLSPGQLLDEVWGRVRGGSAGGAASGVGDVVRDHPVPLALMGLGVAWLAMEKATDSDGDRLRRRHGTVGEGTYGRAEGRVGPYRGDAVSGDESSTLDMAKDKASSAMDAVKDKAGSLASGARSKASDARSSAQAKAADAREQGGDLRDDAGERLDRAREEARHRGRQAKRGFMSAMEDQPLAMGAVAFGLGLAGGLAAPTTRLEDRAMGGASDAVKDEAQQAARDAGRSAKRVAKDTASAAREEAQRQDVVGDLKESAGRIAAEAKDTAKERAQQEDLDPEGLKGRAEERTDRAKDRAKNRMS